MKKHWFLTLGVYCLGVATLPGVFGGVRWWQNPEGHTPKFIEIQHADAKTDSNFDLAGEVQTSFMDELDTSSRTNRRPRQAANLIFDDEFADSNLPIAIPAAKPVPLDVGSEAEPPVLAQNSPSRKTTFPQPFESADKPALEDFESTARQRSASSAPKPELPDGIESLVEAELSDEQKAKLTTLREKLAELTKAKAELVNEQTLEETIFALEKQISNLHAAQKLLSAQQILRALAEEFPDSPAAAKAKRMLDAAESKKSLKPSSDTFSELPTFR